MPRAGAEVRRPHRLRKRKTFCREPVCQFLPKASLFLPKASPSISAESLSVYFCREPLLSFLPKACPSKSGTLNPRPHSQAVVTISRSLTNDFNPRGPWWGTLGLMNPKPSARMNPKPSAHHEKPYSAWALNPGPNVRNPIDNPMDKWWWLVIMTSWLSGYHHLIITIIASGRKGTV